MRYDRRRCPVHFSDCYVAAFRSSAGRRSEAAPSDAAIQSSFSFIVSSRRVSIAGFANFTRYLNRLAR